MFNLSSKQKNMIGFSLTPGLGLEAIVYDKARGVAVNYGRKKVDYNFSQRNIQDYTQFKSAVIELMDEMQIPAKSYAYIVLPNVFFDFIEMPNDATDANIEMALTTTTEEFYIFKKEEPSIGWCDVANPMGTTQRKLAYTAFQKSDIDEIKDIFNGVGLQVAGIETAYSATLRGLNLTGLIKDNILMDSSWGALIINTNSFTLFQMEGKNLLDCNEVPLAIKSFSTEEAYQAIVSSVSQLLSSQMTSQLIIISQTDDISAEALKKLMQFDREIIAIDSNKFSKKPLVEVTSALNFNEANSMTLALLGAVDPKSNFDLTLNILNNDPNSSMGVYFTTTLFGAPTDVTTELVIKIAVVISAIAGIIFGSVIALASLKGTDYDSQISSLTSEIRQLDTSIKEAEKVEVKEEEIDMTEVIDEVAEDNVAAINFYDSIATDIPKNVWLTKYYNKEGRLLAVRGIAESIVDIYEYYKNLRIVSPQSDIKLTELKVVTGPNGDDNEEDIGRFVKSLAIDKDVDRLYSFVISNTEFVVDTSRISGSNAGAETAEELDILAKPAAPEANIEQPSNQMRPTK